MQARARPVLLALALSATLPAQTGSYTYIDQKPPWKNFTGNCPNSPPGLSAANLPRIGTVFQVRVLPSTTVASLGWRCFFATGAKNPDARIDALNGWLYTSADVVTVVPVATCSTTLSFAIPNSSQLVGVHFYQQVYRHFYAGVGQLSRGGHGVIGR